MTKFSDTEFLDFLQYLLEDHCHDFTNYARESLKRRLEFYLINMDMTSIPTLKKSLVEKPSVLNQLIQYLTVSTTEMFRDPQHFISFRENIVPVLKTYPYPKIWIAGCSTGEEVLSYCIILYEEGLLERTSIYATDINNLSLQSAKDAIYKLSKMKVNSKNYIAAQGKAALSDYYNSEYDFAIFNRNLLKNVTFANHCLATDYSFSEFQFISCRNVLIYFNRQLQNRAVGLFYDSLVDLGFLTLGTREDIRFTDYSDRFEICENQSFFRKNFRKLEYGESRV